MLDSYYINDHNGMKLDINKKRKMWKINNNALLNKGSKKKFKGKDNLEIN